MLQDIKKDAFRDAYLHCTRTIENMERELRTACHAPDAKVDTVLKAILILTSLSHSNFTSC